MSQIQQVKEATDILEIIGQRIELKRAGRNHHGLCPFHSEKTPSFFVSPDLQRYKCFGCGESGDVFNFLEQYEGMTFSEALRYLADGAGITLKAYRPSQADEERDQLLEVLDLAKEYYHYLLTEHEVGQKARDYLKDRGTTQDSIKLFQLGYSLPGWDGLVKYLHHKKKYSFQQLVQAGLVIKRKGRHYDRFRDRLMFPLKNHRGQVVGFSGRSLDPEAKQAKYINTSETRLYHKASLLYGYYELRQSIRRKEEVIVTEGEFDVISSTQAHVNHVVAIKGSAFTADHAKYLKRMAQKVLFALDMDSAGIEATRRAIPIAQEAGLELRVIKLAEFDEQHKKDPDDIARDNPKVWRELTKTSISVYQFLIETSLAKYDPTSPEGKRAIIDDLAPALAQISHEVEKDYYLKELSQKLNVTQKVVANDIKQQAFKQQRTSTSVPSADQPQKELTLSRYQKLERYGWFLLLHSPNDQVKARARELVGVIFSNQTLGIMLDRLLEFEPAFSLDKFSQFLPEDLQQFLFELHFQSEYIQILDGLDLDKEWRQVSAELKRLSIQEEIKKITQELDQLDQKRTKTDPEEQRQVELLEKIVALKAKFKSKLGAS